MLDYLLKPLPFVARASPGLICGRILFKKWKNKQKLNENETKTIKIERNWKTQKNNKNENLERIWKSPRRGTPGVKFWSKFEQKNILGTRNRAFRPFWNNKSSKFQRSIMWRQRGLKTQNYDVSFCDFFVPQGPFEITNK